MEALSIGEDNLLLVAYLLLVHLIGWAMRKKG